MNALNTLVLFPSLMSIYIPPPMSDHLTITSITEMPAYLQKIKQLQINKKNTNPD